MSGQRSGEPGIGAPPGLCRGSGLHVPQPSARHRLTRYAARGPAVPLTIGLDPHGGYRPSRSAWVLADIGPITPPIPAIGKQRLWQWNPDGDSEDE